jgi:hypothetical protein
MQWRIHALLHQDIILPNVSHDRHRHPPLAIALPTKHNTPTRAREQTREALAVSLDAPKQLGQTLTSLRKAWQRRTVSMMCARSDDVSELPSFGQNCAAAFLSASTSASWAARGTRT